MSEKDPNPPVADDDFPEFAEPPKQKPGPEALQQTASDPDPDNDQVHVDEVIARLRRKRAEGEN